jgi:hypothetical protein
LRRVSKASDIWEIDLNTDDVQAGIDYGIISRAWTFDRMGAQIKGNFGKAIFRIAVGRAAQHSLERELLERYQYRTERDTHDYKEEDYWDIKTKSGKKADLKTFHVFSDYKAPGRGTLSEGVIVNSTGGENWATFFPMLVPRDQFESETKDYYLFGIVVAPSSKRYPNIRSDAKFLLALPFSEDKEFNARYQTVHRRKYTDERVRSGTSFSLEITRVGQNCLIPSATKVTVGYGDSSGRACQKLLSLSTKKTQSVSGLTSFHYLRLHNMMKARPSEKLFDVVFRDADQYGDINWQVFASLFEDIWIYDAKAYFIGWISKEDFEKAFKRYKAFGPSPDYTGNADHWDPKARGLLSRKSFCYFYPPVFRGGTQGANYYCLPKDLITMASLIEILR